MTEKLDIKFFETLYNRKKIHFTQIAKDVPNLYKFEDYEIIVIGFFPNKKIPRKIRFEDLLKVFSLINIVDKPSGRYLKIHRENGSVKTEI